jgi:hypothetical protein
VEGLGIVKIALGIVQHFGQSLANATASKGSATTDVSNGMEGSEICEQFENEEEIVLK